MDLGEISVERSCQILQGDSFTYGVDCNKYNEIGSKVSKVSQLLRPVVQARKFKYSDNIHNS